MGIWSGYFLRWNVATVGYILAAAFIQGGRRVRPGRIVARIGYDCPILVVDQRVNPSAPVGRAALYLQVTEVLEPPRVPVDVGVIDAGQLGELARIDEAAGSVPTEPVEIGDGPMTRKSAADSLVSPNARTGIAPNCSVMALDPIRTLEPGASGGTLAAKSIEMGRNSF